MPFKCVEDYRESHRVRYLIQLEDPDFKAKENARKAAWFQEKGKALRAKKRGVVAALWLLLGFSIFSHNAAASEWTASFSGSEFRDGSHRYPARGHARIFLTIDGEAVNGRIVFDTATLGEVPLSGVINGSKITATAGGSTIHAVLINRTKFKFTMIRPLTAEGYQAVFTGIARFVRE